MIDQYINKIINADCLDILKELPDKSIDLILTDPPYGIKIDQQLHRAGGYLAGSKTGFCEALKTKFRKTDWDSEIPHKEYFQQMFRVSKHQIIFGANYFVEYLPPSPGWLVWDKKTNGNFADCELIFTSFKKPVKKYTFTWNGLLQEDMKHKEKRIHPAQKPWKLLAKIIEDFTDAQELILDPFIGSGSTALAAKAMKRYFIGIEKDAEYCKIAQRRIEMDIGLFDNPDEWLNKE